MFYTKLQNRRTRDPAWDKYDLDECPGRSCPTVSVKFSKEMTYTPCFTPTQEEVSLLVPYSIGMMNNHYPIDEMSAKCQVGYNLQGA